MVNLEMRTFSTPDLLPRAGLSSWRIGSADFKATKFPAVDRVQELWRVHVPGYGELAFLGERDGENHIMVEIPYGTTPRLRAPFLQALSSESQYA